MRSRISAQVHPDTSALSPCDQDDETLVTEFKRTRESWPFEVLFDRYGKRLYTIAWRLYRNADMAEECVQESFRRAIQQIHCFGEDEDRDHNFWAWLVTIARDVCLSELRRRQTQSKYARRSAAAAASNVPLTQDEQAMISELLELVRTLPQRFRVCYLLLFVDGYTYEEIAKITGYTNGQVRTFIQSARRHVERKFNKPHSTNCLQSHRKSAYGNHGTMRAAS